VSMSAISSEYGEHKFASFRIVPRSFNFGDSQCGCVFRIAATMTNTGFFVIVKSIFSSQKCEDINHINHVNQSNQSIKSIFILYI